MLCLCVCSFRDKDSVGSDQSPRAGRQQEPEPSEEELLRGGGGGRKKGEAAAEEQEDVLTQLSVLSKDKSFALQFATREARQEWFDDITASCRWV